MRSDVYATRVERYTEKVSFQPEFELRHTVAVGDE